jgi:isoleucyl-tRNA synthetase
MDKTSDKKSEYAKIEEQILDLWDSEDTFEQSLSQRKNAPVFSFYDGPPFANGLPHFGHSLVTSVKDSLGRYKTMRGFKVERRNGWDCHGLPVEFAIEKQFGVSGKKQILEFGLDKFNQACKESVFLYKDEWEQFFKRIGRWTDTEHAYATINRDYTESVWWVLKQIHDKGLLYKGYKSMPYCPRCETPLSNFEVNEGYQDNVPDPSLFVKFKIVGEEAYLLAWTTTPWSLPGNAAIAVHPDEQYVYAKLAGEEGQTETLILAKKRLEALKNDKYKVVKELKGVELVGKGYEPLFKARGWVGKSQYENLYKVVASKAVDIQDGTGVLHVAPAFGEEDLSMSDKYKLPVLMTVDASGHIQNADALPEIEGKFFKSADRPIIDYLTHKNLVFAAETINHTYPFCYRCESPLLYYAVSTWFISVSKIKQKLLETAGDINWTPEHIKEGRFGKWLEGARDWAISRNRYWGAPMPVWVNIDDESDYIVVGSTTELQELAGSKTKIDDLHRPLIDDVVIKKDGKTYKRIEEVLDCWFESGSMPVAQMHYPFDNKDEFKSTFPADFITEGLDQTHLWFYVLHVISNILFESPAYKNVLVNGMIMAADGEKLSKRLKNYPPVEDVFASEGADILRLYLLSNYQAVSGDYMRFNRDAMKDLSRNVIGTLQNSLRFFKMYVSIDKWAPGKELKQPEATNILDIWMLTRVNQAIKEVTDGADGYRLAHAVNPIFDLINDTSNWYIRRSRRRFWKSDDDNDKRKAYEVLHFCLLRISQLLAPWAPFYSDYLWRELTGGMDVPKSVHLTDWPDVNTMDQSVLSKMAIAREFIAEGLGQRAEAKIKVRQPLQKVKINDQTSLSSEYMDIITEELNVKQVELDNSGKRVVLDTTITESLRLEGLMRDIVRQVQEARKKAGLDVSDRIHINLESNDEVLKQAIKCHKKDIDAEVLAVPGEAVGGYETSVKIDGQTLDISLSKA